MSVRTTDSDHVAMYDSVTGRAFGPIFESEENLDEFIDWLEDDLRNLSPKNLDAQYEAWLLAADNDAHAEAHGLTRELELLRSDADIVDEIGGF